MYKLSHILNLVPVFVATLIFAYFPSPVSAHCDSLEGPVVKDARTALNTGKVTIVLKWVQKHQESKIRDAFEQTILVRTKGEAAKALADRYFFETLVRIHRAGEGEAFTGLKPATNVDPGIESADKALKSGSITELADHLSAAVKEGIHERFKLVRERQINANDSVILGREYVDAYVDYIHYVEKTHHIVTKGTSHLHHKSVDTKQQL